MDSGNSLLFPHVVPEVAEPSTTLLTKHFSTKASQKSSSSKSHHKSQQSEWGSWAKPAGSVPLCCFAIATWTQVSRPSKAAFTAKAFSLFVCLFYAWQPFHLFNQFFFHLSKLLPYANAINTRMSCVSKKANHLIEWLGDRVHPISSKKKKPKP